MNESIETILRRQSESAIELLQKLIATPSISREEVAAADVLAAHIGAQGVALQRIQNNIWCVNTAFEASKFTLLLNSHLDTVKANSDWKRDPLVPQIEDARLYGLGSNDAGGPLVSYAAVFLALAHREDLPINLVFAATAEEEISGVNGIQLAMQHMPRIDAALVGEPTQMQMATAEKGLMVLRCCAHGRSGHAARNEGENAIDIALSDITWVHAYRFERESTNLGPVKMTTTMIHAGTQHNVIPDRCEFTVDVRSTDAYTNDEIESVVRAHLRSEVAEVSKRLQPSCIDEGHLIVRAARALSIPTYGSPTLSDQALLRVPSVKIGPGDSARSHTADEYIGVQEIHDGVVELYRLIEMICTLYRTDESGRKGEAQ